MSVKNGSEQIWDLRLGEVAKNLEANNFVVTVLPNLVAAVAYFKDTLLPEIAPKSVSTGGSESVKHSGVYDILKNSGLHYINPYDAKNTEEAMEMRRQALLVDLYITSTNALLRDGRLLNLDFMANRVAAMLFGPKKVVLFVGRNKISEDLEAGIDRIQEFSAPANNIRLNTNNPCSKTGYCMDCKSEKRICSAWTMISKCSPPKRIHVLLVNEDLGF